MSLEPTVVYFFGSSATARAFAHGQDQLSQKGRIVFNEEEAFDIRRFSPEVSGTLRNPCHAITFIDVDQWEVLVQYEFSRKDEDAIGTSLEVVRRMESFPTVHRIPEIRWMYLRILWGIDEEIDIVGFVNTWDEIALNRHRHVDEDLFYRSEAEEEMIRLEERMDDMS